MIYVLHGEDSDAAYRRLSAILANFPNHQKIKLTEKSSEQDLYLALFSEDLISSDKIIICENFLQTKKIKGGLLKKIRGEQNVIFWERTQLLSAAIAKIKSIAQIENFKPQPQIFWFLDSLSPDSKKAIASLAKVENQKNPNLLYHLAARTLLLILAKLNLDYQTAAQITGKNIADWQWAKYKNQAAQFSLQTLYFLYSGTLKIDSLIKSGATNVKEKTLISILFLKYLPRY